MYICPSVVTPNSGAPTANGAEVNQRCPSADFRLYPDPFVQHFAGGQSPGTISGGDALVQSGARELAGRRDQGD